MNTPVIKTLVQIFTSYCKVYSVSPSNYKALMFAECSLSVELLYSAHTTKNFNLCLFAETVCSSAYFNKRLY